MTEQPIDRIYLPFSTSTEQLRNHFAPTAGRSAAYACTRTAAPTPRVSSATRRARPLWTAPTEVQEPGIQKLTLLAGPHTETPHRRYGRPG
jgi:hypothetical protein